jgi:hypothetical protein
MPLPSARYPSGRGILVAGEREGIVMVESKCSTLVAVVGGFVLGVVAAKLLGGGFAACCGCGCGCGCHHGHGGCCCEEGQEDCCCQDEADEAVSEEAAASAE